VRDYFFPPLVLPFFILLVLPFMIFSFVFVTSSVFQLVFGIGKTQALLIFLFIILGSFVNIPIYETTGERIVREYFLGFIYTVRKREKILIAVNLGGCILPSILAIKALFDLSIQIPLIYWIIAFLLTSLLIYISARPVPGVGIVVPMFVPPIFASLISFIIVLASGAPTSIIPKHSFSIGVLSSLFGADLLHLKDLQKIGPGVVSIGGAGTFDGIFLTGVFSVIFSLFLI